MTTSPLWKTGTTHVITVPIHEIRAKNIDIGDLIEYDIKNITKTKPTHLQNKHKKIINTEELLQRIHQETFPTNQQKTTSQTLSENKKLPAHPLETANEEETRTSFTPPQAAEAQGSPLPSQTNSKAGTNLFKKLIHTKKKI